MMRAALCALWLLAASCAQAEWSIVDATESPADAGVRHLRITLADADHGGEATVQLAIANTREDTVRVIDQPNESEASLAETMARTQSLAGVNGGYFDAENAPVGLLISDRKTIAPLRKAPLLSGVISVSGGKIRLQRRADFSAKSKPATALQCGPFLIEHQKVVPGLNDRRPARRTFFALGPKDEFALGFCSSVSLAQLAEILAAIGRDRFKIERALNLDGGSSSAFWVRDGERPFSISEQKTVRDFLAVIRK